MDPACFVPALRTCCGGGGGSDGGSDDEGDGRDDEAGAEAGAALLDKMEARAGVTPDAWCANVVMEVSGWGSCTYHMYLLLYVIRWRR